jgi:hypothetical protein
LALGEWLLAWLPLLLALLGGHASSSQLLLILSGLNGRIHCRCRVLHRSGPCCGVGSGIRPGCLSGAWLWRGLHPRRRWLLLVRPYAWLRTLVVSILLLSGILGDPHLLARPLDIGMAFLV